MDVSRRLFLGGSLAVAAAATIPLIRAIPAMPSLYGDGIHDDTVGLQALFDRNPVNIVGDSVMLLRSGEIYLSGGRFKTTKTVVIQHSLITIDGIEIIADLKPEETFFLIKGCSHINICNTRFTNAEAA